MTTYVNFLSYVPHGQCWAMRLPLMNTLVHPDEMLPVYNERLVVAYEDIVNTPDVSMISHKYGARTGNDLDDDERRVRLENIIAIGDLVADAWKAVFEGDATEDQEELVYNSHAYKLMMAWVAFNDDHADEEQMALLEDSHSYATKMAWKAFDAGTASKEQMELLEESHFYKLKMARKAKREGNASKEQLAMIENDNTRREKWDEYFNELKQFKNIHGHCDVPAADFGLGCWVGLVSSLTCTTKICLACDLTNLILHFVTIQLSQTSNVLQKSNLTWERQPF